MVLLDIIILVIAVYAAFMGFRSGLVMQITTLLAVGLGIWGAIHFSDQVEVWLNEQVELGTMTGSVSFALTFFVILVAINLLGRFITNGLDLAMLSLPNKLAGALLSITKYALIVSALVQAAEGAGVMTILLPEEKRTESMLFEPLRSLAPVAIPAIRDSPWVRRTWDTVREGVDLTESE